MRAILESAVIGAIGCVGIWGSLKIPAAGVGDTWAGIMPLAASIALNGLAGLMALGALRQQATSAGAETEGGESATLEIIGLFLIALVYQQSLNWFGYILPTAVVAPIVLYMFGVRRWLGLALSVVLCPLVFHIIFFELLGAFPPFGMVFDLLDYFRG